MVVIFTPGSSLLLAANIWLSPTGAVNPDSAPPMDAADVPLIRQVVTQASGTLYVWASFQTILRNRSRGGECVLVF